MLYFYMRKTPGVDCATVNDRFGDGLVDMAYAEYQYYMTNNFDSSSLS